MMESKRSEAAMLAGELEWWLRDDVVPTYDAIKSEPLRAVASADVFTAIRLHHMRRMKEQET